MSKQSFPEGFIWGASTAGHQVEGNNSNSDVWFLEQVPETSYREPSGKACNSYELWREDVELIKKLGLNAYRFSIEWARIEPTKGTFDKAELAHYEAIVDYCRTLNIEPIVTLNHFAAPHWFAAEAGWLNPESSRSFGSFVKEVITAFGSKLHLVVTLNEPNLPMLLTYLNLPDFIKLGNRKMLESAAREAGVTKYSVANSVNDEDLEAFEQGLISGHKAARDVIRRFAPHIELGLSIAITDDRALAGGESHRDSKRQKTYEKWLELAKEDDFIGIQNYEAQYFDSTGPVDTNSELPRNGFGSPIDPTSLAGAIRYATEFSGKPALVTEHGLGLQEDNDKLREEFIPASLRNLLMEINAGVAVIGYCVWSLLDNFEWSFGYGAHFGIVAVNRESFERLPKASSAAYSEVAKANGFR